FGRRVYHEDRLLYPLRRNGRKGAGAFVRISWDEAIAEITTRSNLSSNSGVGKQFCHITMAAPTACSAARFLTIFILPPSAHHVWPKLFALRLRRKWQPACTARCRVWLLRITRKQSASSFGAPTRKQPISTWCPCSARRKRTALLSPS